MAHETSALKGKKRNYAAGILIAVWAAGSAFLAGQSRYPGERDNSPMTLAVADRLRAVAAAGVAGGKNPALLIKVGDSITANGSFLSQFKCPDHDPAVHYGWEWTRDLGGFPELGDAADHFCQLTFPAWDSNIPDAHVGGVGFPTTCLDRVSLAVQVGQSAEWAVTGSPSPLQQEIETVHPLFAVIMFGANDIGGYGDDLAVLGRTVENQLAIVDACLAGGIIPILSATCPNYTNAQNIDRSRTLSHLVRALAQGRQIPFVNCHRALMSLPNHGLGGDDLHPNALGYNRGCHLTAEGLLYGHNRRNLATLTALDQGFRTIIQGVPALDPEPPALAGSGTSQDPFVIDAIPFSDFGQTTAEFPSRWYRLELLLPLDFQGLVTDQGATDVNLRLLDHSLSQIETHDGLIERLLEPGTYYLEIQTSSGYPGEYQMVVLDRTDAGYPKDMNLDGIHDGADRQVLATYLAGNTAGLPCGSLCGDLDGDGLDAADLVALGKIFVAPAAPPRAASAAAIPSPASR